MDLFHMQHGGKYVLHKLQCICVELLYCTYLPLLCGISLEEACIFCFCAMKPEPDAQTHSPLSVFCLRLLGPMCRYGDRALFSNEKEAVAVLSGAETIA